METYPFNPNAEASRDKLSPEVLSYIDNLKEQIGAICQKYNLRTKADLAALENRPEVPTEAIKRLHSLLDSLRQASETEKLPFSELERHAKDANAAYLVLKEQMETVKTDMSKNLRRKNSDEFVDTAFKICEELAIAGEVSLAQRGFNLFSRMNKQYNPPCYVSWYSACLEIHRAKDKQDPKTLVRTPIAKSLIKNVEKGDPFLSINEIPQKIITYYIDRGDKKNAEIVTGIIDNKMVQRLERARISGGWEQVERDARKAYAKDSSDIDATTYLVQAYIKLGRLEEALAVIENTDVDPIGDVKRFVVEEYLRQGKLDEAIEMFGDNEESNVIAVSAVLGELVKTKQFDRAQQFYLRIGHYYDVRTEISYYRSMAFVFAEQGIDIPKWVADLFEKYQREEELDRQPAAGGLAWYEAAETIAGLKTGVAIRKLQFARRLFGTDHVKQQLPAFIQQAKHKQDVLAGIDVLNRDLVNEFLPTT